MPTPQIQSESITTMTTTPTEKQMQEAVRQEIQQKLGATITELKAMLERATADEMGAFGAYVISTSPGCYYRDGAQGLRTIMWATRYVTRLGAALSARHVRDGNGSQGQVLEYRVALQAEIDRMEWTLQTLLNPEAA